MVIKIEEGKGIISYCFESFWIIYVSMFNVFCSY